jgi:hypothetical protein
MIEAMVAQGAPLAAIVIAVRSLEMSRDIGRSDRDYERLRKREWRDKIKVSKAIPEANDAGISPANVPKMSRDNGDKRHESTSLLSVLLPEKSLQEVSKKEVNGRARGTRLLADTKLSPADREFAAKHGADPDKLWAEFIDFWIGVPGARGLKINWSSTWRNRVRTVSGQTGAPNGNDRRSVIAAADRLLGSGFKLKPKPGTAMPPSGQANLQLLSKG